MSTATVQLAQFLFTCFAAGCAITWVLQHRRWRRERQEQEQSIALALHSRHSTYQGLEQSVATLMDRFETVEQEFHTRLEQAASPSSTSMPTVALRSHNPELWDLEREHQSVQAQQQAELSQQRARVVELMDQLERLEPDKLAVVEELARVQSRYDNVVANSKETERATAAGMERLQQRLRELEPLVSQLEASRRELAQARNAQAASEQAHTVELSGLQTQLAFLQPLEAQVEQLHADVARSKSDLTQADARRKRQDVALSEALAAAETLRGEVTLAQRKLNEANAQRVQLERNLSRSNGELEEARTAAQASLAKAESLQLTLEQARTESERSNAAAKARIVELESTLGLTKSEVELQRKRISAQSHHVEAAWSVLSELKPMLESLEQNLKVDAALPKPASSSLDLSMLDDPLPSKPS